MKARKVEEMKIEEIQTAIEEYKKNLIEVDSIIEIEKQKTDPIKNISTSGNLNDLLNLKSELKKAITYHEEVLKFKLNSENINFNDQPLHKSDVGRICLAFYDEDQKWYTAMINEIDEETKKGEVTWLGFKEKTQLPYSHIKVQEKINPEEIETGYMCEAIYYEDGKWYPAVIETKSEHGVHVRYTKYEEVEIVSYDSIRFTPEQRQANLNKKKNPKQEVDINAPFKLPDHLKMNPNDNEQQRLLKRKRVKQLKQNHKQKVIEIISKEKQEQWQNFNSKLNKSGKFGYAQRK